MDDIRNPVSLLRPDRWRTHPCGSRLGRPAPLRNVSFGLYADALLESGYREDKARTLAAVAPDYFKRRQCVEADLDTPRGTVPFRKLCWSPTTRTTSPLRAIGGAASRLPQDCSAASCSSARPTRRRTSSGTFAVSCCGGSPIQVCRVMQPELTNLSHDRGAVATGPWLRDTTSLPSATKPRPHRRHQRMVVEGVLWRRVTFFEAERSAVSQDRRGSHGMGDRIVTCSRSSFSCTVRP